MANKILTKKSSTAGAQPTAADLDVGELAVNTSDGKLFTKHTDDSIVEVVGSTGGTTNLTAGVIWDNHSTTAYDYTNDGVAGSSGTTATDITVVADKTAVLTHASDSEELRSVYIEKFVEIPATPIPTKKIVIVSSLSSGAVANAFGRLRILTDAALTTEFNVGDRTDTSITESSFSNGVNITATSAHSFAFEVGYVLDMNSDAITFGWPSQLFTPSSPGVTDGYWHIGTDGSGNNLTEDQTITITFDTPIIMYGISVVTNPDASYHSGGSGRGADLAIQFLDESLSEIGTLAVPEQTAVATPSSYNANITTPAASTYWQLESFDDWGVQFTSPTTTTLINNTTADAVIRARITKPTAVAVSTGDTNLTAGVIWDNHSTTAYEYTNDGSATLSSGTTATDITVVADKTAVLTHTSDTEELRSVYIEKFVEIPSVVVATKKVTVYLSNDNATGLVDQGAIASGKLRFYNSSVEIDLGTRSDGADVNTVSTFTNSTTGVVTTITASSYNSAYSGHYYYYPGNLIDNALNATTYSNDSFYFDFLQTVTLTIEFSESILLDAFSIITVPGVHNAQYKGDGSYPQNPVVLKFFGEVDNVLYSTVNAPIAAAMVSTTFNANIPLTSSSTYWQLESFDDWDVRFTSPTQTTLINNTDDDAVIRARITKPTSVSTNAYGALELTTDGAVISPTAGILVTDTTTKAITHTADASNLRSVYIEKFVDEVEEVPNYGKTVVANGGVHHSTAFKKTGESSISFDGVSDYLTVANHSDFELSGDFTIEMFFYANTLIVDNQYPNLIMIGTHQLYVITTTNVVGFWMGATAGAVTGSALTTGQWYHLAAVRSSGVCTFYVDGVAQSTVNNTETVGSGDIIIGSWSGTGGDVNGFMDEIRISKSAIYTSDFTPSTDPLSYNANTVLLIQSDTTDGSATFADSVAATPAIPAHWQLETYNDWGVQFTDPETTTITNNTGADATARFRITAPTAAASSSTASSGGSSIGAIYQTPVAGELFNTTDTQTKTITHTEDSSNLRSVYIEKFVEEVPATSITNSGFLRDSNGWTTEQDNTTTINTTYSAGIFYEGVLDNLIDGDVSSADCSFTHQLSNVGLFMQFEFPTPTIITGFTWKGGSNSQGTWDFQGSNDGTSWTSTGSTFEILPVNDTLTISTMSSNTTAYTYYRLLGVSGAFDGVHYIKGFGFLVGAEIPAQNPIPAYWQLDTFEDWGVEFLSGTETKVTNNTGSDATARIRITAPTAAASGSGGGATTLADLTDSTTATIDPLITENLAVGHFWINSTSGEAYVCTGATTDNNVWSNVGTGDSPIQPVYVATGGTVTTNATHKYHTFTSSGSLVIPSGWTQQIEYLIVAGGGAGGAYWGAGGGAGGVIYGSVTDPTAATHSIVIGDGGAYSSSTRGTNGEDSSALGLTAIGGGAGGGNYSPTDQTQYGGVAGGSGGGAKGSYTPGSGTTGQGNSGGVDTSGYKGSGGGGKGSIGGSSDGGSGIDYWGYSVGGGGAGGDGSATHGGGYGTTSAVANSGGGGGYGGNGASGIVAVRYTI
jgi:hypothetical protein